MAEEQAGRIEKVLSLNFVLLPSSASPVFELLLGRRCVDCAVDHFEWYSIEEFAAGARWSGDAFAAVRLIVGVMGLAHEIAALFRKELIIDPIHRERNVPAAIQVGVKLPLVIDQKAFLIDASNRQQELSRFAWLQFTGQRDPVANSGSPAVCPLLLCAASAGSTRAMPIPLRHLD